MRFVEDERNNERRSTTMRLAREKNGTRFVGGRRKAKDESKKG